MKTDFNSLRKWRRAQAILAIVMIVLGFFGFMDLYSIKTIRINLWVFNIVSLASVVVSFCVCRCSRCPYCGKSVMSGWTGKDGAGRNCVKRIAERLPVVCAHCGEELDTDEE